MAVQSPRRTAGRRLAQAALVVAMALGSLALWTVIPFGWLRLAATLSSTYATIYLLAIIGAPLTMVAWGWCLYRLNYAYLRRTGRAPPAPAPGWERPAVGPRRDRGQMMVIDVFLVVSAVIGVSLLVVWYLLLGHAPTSTPWPDELSGG
jgi:hypothetical protein